MKARDRVVELRRVPAGELGSNPRNWRLHPAGQSKALASILERVGYADALIARELEDGSLELIDGHLRKETTPDQPVPVLVVDVTEEEAGLLLATLDPLAGLAETDQEALYALLQTVEIPDADLASWLEELTGQAGPPVGFGDPDEVPEPPTDPVTQPGDLWVLGDHRLVCGDATRPEALETLLAGDLAECLWTDPPYGVSYVGKTREALTIQNDGQAGLSGLLLAAFQSAAEGLIGGAPFYVAAPAGPQGTVFRIALAEAGLRFHQALVWVKDSMVLGHSDYHYRHEDILYGWAPGEGRAGRGHHEGSRWYGDNAQTTVLEIDRPKASEEHPTMKPVALVATCLRNSTRSHEAVLDLFGGSGTTLLAAEETGRRAFLMEIDPGYCDVIVTRWENFTGKKATREAHAEAV